MAERVPARRLLDPLDRVAAATVAELIALLEPFVAVSHSAATIRAVAAIAACESEKRSLALLP